VGGVLGGRSLEACNVYPAAVPEFLKGYCIRGFYGYVIISFGRELSVKINRYLRFPSAADLPRVLAYYLGERAGRISRNTFAYLDPVSNPFNSKLI